MGAHPISGGDRDDPAPQCDHFRATPPRSTLIASSNPTDMRHIDPDRIQNAPPCAEAREHHEYTAWKLQQEPVQIRWLPPGRRLPAHPTVSRLSQIASNGF